MRATNGRGTLWCVAGMVMGLVLALGGVGLAAPMVGQPPPNFSLTLLDGRKVTLNEFRGKPIVVNFWHSG